MKIAWVLGWAIPEAWFAPIARSAFPGAEHVFFAGNAGVLTQLASAAPFGRIVGYSLGAHLLLSSAARASALGQVDLLAPIFAFSAEEGLGGRVSRAQVRQLSRWLRSSPDPALRDFYVRAGLDVPPSLAPVDATAELQWGLERLANDRVEPPLPSGWSAWCGSDDALLDAGRLHALDGRITVVKAATHHPAALVRALLDSVRPAAAGGVPALDRT